ncbi:MAG: DNA methyltransferase, partial [Planctomycetota bacterium]
MPTIKLKDIVFDEEIYPRSSWDKDTVKFYMERLMAGDEPPPLILEEETNRLLDGKHRVEARLAYARWWKKEAKAEEKEVFPEPVDEVEVEYEEIPEDIPPKLWCAQYNRDHGDRLSGSDGKALAREIYMANPKISQGMIGTNLGVPQRTVSDWIVDLRAREMQKREWNIEVLRRLGWTHEEIGEATGLSRRRVSEVVAEIAESLKPPKTQLAKTRQIEEVAAAYNMPVQLATALDLDRIREDRDRAKQLDVTLRPHDAWMFNGHRDLFGHEYPGRIPGDLLLNVLYFYTEQNDIVLDPMAGSGTTADVCLVMDRRCYCYDVDEKACERAEVSHHDLCRDGWPPRTENADLIFWDPPYFWKMDAKQVGEKEGYGEKSISRFDRDDYLGFFSRAFKLAHEVSKASCTLALLMADWYDYDDPAKSIYIWDYAQQLQDAKWQIERQVQIPQTMHLRPHVYEKFCGERRLASVARYLLITKKVQ